MLVNSVIFFFLGQIQQLSLSDFLQHWPSCYVLYAVIDSLIAVGDGREKELPFHSKTLPAEAGSGWLFARCENQD